MACGGPASRPSASQALPNRVRPPIRWPCFADLGLSTVNDVDQLPGRVALALLLGGGEPGDYGVGDGATAGVSPPIEPVPATTGAP